MINPDRGLPGYHEAQLLTVSGLAAHAFRCGEVASHLLKTGLWLESAPLVRLGFECAVTALWSAQVPDGAAAILNKDYRSRRIVRDTLDRLGISGSNSERSDKSVEVAEGRGETVARESTSSTKPDEHDSTDAEHESTSNAQAKAFEQMCNDLEPGGPQAYAYYRAMSWFSHPTNYVIDNFAEISTQAGQAESLRLRREPAASDENTYLFQYFIAMSLTWAASAINILDADHTHAAKINELAERALVQPTMLLSSKGRARVKALSNP